MEDRYLFRGKRIDNGERIIGSLLVDKQQDIGTGEQIEIIGIYPSEYKDFAKKIDPSTICQCTGLKDKNSNLIWENDIIETQYGKAVVVWDKAEWRIKWIEDTIWRRDLHFGVNEDDWECEVIGNKFDNPELLEVEECRLMKL